MTKGLSWPVTPALTDASIDGLGRRLAVVGITVQQAVVVSTADQETRLAALMAAWDTWGVQLHAVGTRETPGAATRTTTTVHHSRT